MPCYIIHKYVYKYINVYILYIYIYIKHLTGITELNSATRVTLTLRVVG